MREACLQFSRADHTAKPFVLFIEPWGEDYTFRSAKVIKIVATGASPGPWFHVHIDAQGAFQVYLEGHVDTFQVLEGGIPVSCGYGRYG